MQVRTLRLVEPAVTVDLHPRLTVLEVDADLGSRLAAAIVGVLTDPDAAVLGTVERDGIALDLRIPIGTTAAVGGHDGTGSAPEPPLVEPDALRAPDAGAVPDRDALLAARARAADRLRRAEARHERARRDPVEPPGAPVAVAPAPPADRPGPAVSEAELARRLALRAELEDFLAAARADGPEARADDLVERGTVLASRIAGICPPDGVREVLAVVDAIAAGSGLPGAADVPRARAALAASIAAAYGGEGHAYGGEGHAYGGEGHASGGEGHAYGGEQRANGSEEPAPGDGAVPEPARLLGAYAEVVSARRALARIEAALAGGREAADRGDRLRARIASRSGPGRRPVVLDDPIGAVDPTEQPGLLDALVAASADIQLVYLAPPGPVVAWAQDLEPRVGVARSLVVQEALFPGGSRA